MAPDLVRHIDSTFYKAMRTIDPKSTQALCVHYEVARNLPYLGKKLSCDQAKIDAAFSIFNAPLRESLSDFVVKNILYSHLGDSHLQSALQQFPSYFVGSPGTGKTHTAKLLAHVLKVPLAVLNLDGASIEDIVGIAAGEAGQGRPGRIVESLISANVMSEGPQDRGIILFIDKFDRLLTYDDKQSRDVLAFMLKLLDPSQGSFYNPFLNSYICLLKTVILAGNSDLRAYKDQRFEALISRIKTIEFTGFKRDTIRNFAFNILVPQYEKSLSIIADPLFKFRGLNKEERLCSEKFIDQTENLDMRNLANLLMRFLKSPIDVLIKKTLLKLKTRRMSP